MSYFKNLNPYEIHKKLINEYILRRPGDTKQLFQRDTSKDRTDFDVLRDNHRFLWDDDDDEADTWEKRFARRYYDKLFKEYCIADLSRYKENKIALRWRIEKEVMSGKGQFICGNKICNERNELRSWEVNFAYIEHEEKKNALIKLRLCPDCSVRLNYYSKKREVKRIKKQIKKDGKKGKTKGSSSPGTSNQNENDAEELQVTSLNGIESNNSDRDSETDDAQDSDHIQSDKSVPTVDKCWAKIPDAEDKTREEEFDDYLADLLL